MKRVFLVIINFLIFFTGHSQGINPLADEIYREDEVAIIQLTMDPADKAFLLHDDNVWSSTYLEAEFRFTNSLMDTVLAFNVGVRLRGNSSRTQPKRSFKLKFKEFDGEKFYGYKKFNLKAENNDPSMIREMLSMQTFRKANVPAARTHHSEVYINGEYMGIYLNVEQLDDEFVKSRYGYDEGNIYKCSWPANLVNDNQIYNNDTYELKTNKDINDRSVLANFVDILNNSTDDDFEDAIEEVFNVDSYLHYLAAEVLVGHWDGYSYNKNNFYLYENNETGLIEFIPYDTDNTFGIDWVDRDWGTRDVLDWPRHNDPRPLTKRIMAREKYIYKYKLILDEMLMAEFSEAYFFPLFDNFKSMLADPFSRDVYFPLTFGFTYSDFENSFTEQVISHAPYGLKPYITTRTTSARDQIGVVTGLVADLEIGKYELYPNPSTGKMLMLRSQKEINTIKIRDVLGRGQNITVSPIGNSTYKIEFDLSKGLYIIYTDGNSSSFVVK